MKHLRKFAIPAVLAASAALAAPAAAQVQGAIGSVDITTVVTASNARASAYSQLPTTYEAQIKLQTEKGEELQKIYQIFDKNNDKNIDDAEMAAARKLPQYARAEALEKEIEQLSAQIESGLVFAIDQILRQVPAAIEQAAKQKKVDIVLTPSAVVYAPPAMDISQEVVNVLNARLPMVGVVPEQGWQPSQQAIQMTQQVEQRLRLIAAIQQRQQQAQQGGAAAPVQGNEQAPVGR